MKKDKISSLNTNAATISSRNKDIRDYFAGKKASKVRQQALGPKVNFWNPVKVAKNLCPTDIPLNLTIGGLPLLGGDVARCKM